MCTQGNMGEQPVAECFTLYKYIGNKKKIKIKKEQEILPDLWDPNLEHICIFSTGQCRMQIWLFTDHGDKQLNGFSIL